MDSNKIDILTKSLNASIKTFLIKENNVNTTFQGVGDFIVYLQEQHSHLSKYKSVESDIIKYLDIYDFKQGNNFEVVKHCCETLSDIEEKIAQMSQMTKSVCKRSDRYELVASINNCVDFTHYCAEKMTMGEVDAMLKKSLSLIKKMQHVIDSFKEEDDSLKDILEVHRLLLRRYPAYKRELKLFLSSNSSENNVEYTKQHLQGLSVIDKKFIEIKKEIELIKKYADRYDKKRIESKSEIILDQGRKNLIYTDLFRVNNLINEALERINEMKKKFQEEERRVWALRNELQTCGRDMWGEDFERISKQINQIVTLGTRYAEFSIADLIREKELVIQKKTDEIQTIKSKYYWLKRRRYQQRISYLSIASHSYNEFVGGINIIRRNRTILTRLYELFYK